MNNNIIFVETTDCFPFKFTANNSKVKLLAEGLLVSGDKVTIINKIQGSDFVTKDYEYGFIENIPYYTFAKYNRSRLSIVWNLINQFLILKKLKKENMNNVIIMGQPYFLIFLIETVIYKLLGYKIGITKTEYPSAFNNIKGIKKIDAWLSDNLFGYFVDYIFPISQYIEIKCLKYKKVMFKIPILASFKKEENKKVEPQNYFLLCSTLAYKENVLLVIDAFRIFLNKCKHTNFSLKLVLSGKNDEMRFIYEYISNCCEKERIEVYNQVAYDVLISLYKGANALLIPLQNTIQDKARFSQKIAEYLSTSRPIITNPIGDIELYFTNQYNAYIAKSYNAEDFAEIMKRIVNKPEEARAIGERGYLTGVSNFDNIHLCSRLSNFMRTRK